MENLKHNGSLASCESSIAIGFPMVRRSMIKSISPDAAKLLTSFGLGGKAGKEYKVATIPRTLAPDGKSIILINGPSGSGKSQTLQAMLSLSPTVNWSMNAPAFFSRPLIDTWEVEPQIAVQRLTEVGLSDPFTWCRTPDELSDGQQARFRLALMLNTDERPIIVDEYLATLDRITARAVAWATQKALRRRGRGAILVTSHDDLIDDVGPDVYFRLDWSPKPIVSYAETRPPVSSIHHDITYRRGDAGDWGKLRHLHYAAGDPATIHSYHVLEIVDMDTPAAVAVVSYPDLHSAARNLATDDAYRIGGNRERAQRLNREVLKLSRIVVTPELRGCGLATRLVSEAWESLSCRYLECVTSMGPYSHWLEHAGFREVPQTAAQVEAELLDWATKTRLPAHVSLDADELKTFIDGLSVREARTGRRLVWSYYHHFVVHRRTRSPRPKKIPGPLDEHWPEAFDVVARRLYGRPSYWIMGPRDPMTNMPED